MVILKRANRYLNQLALIFLIFMLPNRYYFISKTPANGSVMRFLLRKPVIPTRLTAILSHCFSVILSVFISQISHFYMPCFDLSIFLYSKCTHAYLCIIPQYHYLLNILLALFSFVTNNQLSLFFQNIFYFRCQLFPLVKRYNLRFP